MGALQHSDSIRQAAVEWVVREHEAAFDAQARMQLNAWLADSEEHRVAYEKARYVWLLTGLVPPRHDI